LGALGLLLAVLPVGPLHAQGTCQFTLGFAALRQAAGAGIVGDCLANERFNVANGNAEQATTRGLLVWRKADNWTAFTNGHETWINGPQGLQRRLNTDRFSWENDREVFAPIRMVVPCADLGVGYAETQGGSINPNDYFYGCVSPTGPTVIQLIAGFTDQADAAGYVRNSVAELGVGAPTGRWFEVSVPAIPGARGFKDNFPTDGKRAIIVYAVKGHYVAAVNLIYGQANEGRPGYTVSRAAEIASVLLTRVPG